MIGEGERPKISEQVPLEYANMMEKCWKINPEERPTFIEILETLDLSLPVRSKSEQ